MNDTFGRLLRAERERRKISLTSIADNTKISITLLEGLERDDVSRWPSGIFRRGFIRAYAKAIGLDTESVLREFLKLYPDSAETHEDLRAIKAPPPVDDPPLRLMLAENWFPFAGGRLVRQIRQRWVVAAWDCGVLLAVAVTLFVASGHFWLPFGISSLCYYLGGILIMGNTPGVCLFGPTPAQNDKTPSSELARSRSRRRATKKASRENRGDRLRLVRRA